MWQLATLLDGVGVEHFPYCRKVCWTVLPPERVQQNMRTPDEVLRNKTQHLGNRMGGSTRNKRQESNQGLP